MTDQLQALLKDYQPQPLGEKRSYAVFLPLVWSDNQWQVLYEIRSESISQPGRSPFLAAELMKARQQKKLPFVRLSKNLTFNWNKLSCWGNRLSSFWPHDDSLFCRATSLGLADPSTQ